MPAVTARGRLRKAHRLIHGRVPSAHYESEMDAITDAVLARRHVPGVIAEFGCFKGGSTAKLSLVAEHVGKRLVVFDSFEGLPEPEPWDADHEIERPRTFARGQYEGTLAEVRANVGANGRLDVCEFVPGWFAESLESFDREVAVAFVDVDLAASTRDVLTHVWPRVSPGGIVFVHDASDEKLQAVILDGQLTPGAVERFVPRRADLPSLPTKTLAWIEKGHDR